MKKTISTQPRRHYRYLTLLVSLFVTTLVCAEVYDGHLVTLFGLPVSGGVYLYITCILILDVVTEVYGYGEAKRMLFYGLLALLVLAFSSYFMQYTSVPPYWKHVQHAYEVVLHPIPRATLASIFSVFVSKLVNSYLLSRWKMITRGKYFIIRSISSTIIGDFVDGALGVPAIFIGRMANEHVINLLLGDYIVIIIAAVILAIPALILVHLLTKAEGVSVIEQHITFNPFKTD